MVENDASHSHIWAWIFFAHSFRSSSKSLAPFRSFASRPPAPLLIQANRIIFWAFILIPPRKPGETITSNCGLNSFDPGYILLPTSARSFCTNEPTYFYTLASLAPWHMVITIFPPVSESRVFMYMNTHTHTWIYTSRKPRWTVNFFFRAKPRRLYSLRVYNTEVDDHPFPSSSLSFVAFVLLIYRPCNRVQRSYTGYSS